MFECFRKSRTFKRLTLIVAVGGPSQDDSIQPDGWRSAVGGRSAAEVKMTNETIIPFREIDCGGLGLDIKSEIRGMSNNVVNGM